MMLYKYDIGQAVIRIVRLSAIDEGERAAAEAFISLERADHIKGYLSKGNESAYMQGLFAGYLLERTVKELSSVGDDFEIRYHYSKEGRPSFANLPFDFSLSHSGDWAGCAIMKAGDGKYEIGLDIEDKNRRLKKKNCSRIASRFFTQEERDLLENSGNEEAYAKVFRRLWTAKEAYAKSVGVPLIRVLGEEVPSGELDVIEEEGFVASIFGHLISIDKML